MKDCIFCKIANGEIPSKIVYQDDLVCVFEDLEPQAPVHLLCIPKEHISSIDEITQENADVISHIYLTISSLAKKLGLNEGYRVVSNCGEQGGQTVMHLHFHLLGGRKFGWPPG